MNPVVPGLIASLLYLIAAAIQLAGISRTINFKNQAVLGTACAAIILHALTVNGELLTPDGINMSIFVMGSVTSVVITMLVVISSLRRPIHNLFIGLFPFAVITLLLSLFADGNYQPRPDLSIGLYSHIVLSIVAYSLLTIAVFQAIFLTFQDYELRNKNIALLRSLPALQTMDALLFELLWAGLIFLTLSIATGFVFVETMATPGLMHHAVITFAAWIVFSILLWGRYRLGWRGNIASRWTVAGFFLLILGYFGSKLVIEVILG